MKMSIKVLEDKTGEISQKAEQKIKRIQTMEKRRKKSES